MNPTTPPFREPRSYEPRPTRRTLLKAGSALAASSAFATTGLAQRSHANDLAGERPIDPAVWLLQRASFGFTQEDAVAVRVRGFAGWVDWQLQPNSIPDTVLDGHLATYDWLGQSADDMLRHPTKSKDRIGWEYMNLRLLRAVHSKRQLFERLVQFWNDHFSTYAVGRPILKVWEDQNFIRPLALGSFRDLLHASAKSAAMMDYLDTDTNVVGAPNENYAREVMELHTLGVTGPYTEDDIRELARCLTGWNYVTEAESLGQGLPYAQFRFTPGLHDSGSKSLLGLTIPAGGGVNDAETVLDHLAQHPATATYVCTKLARWFLVYDPPREVVDAAVDTWTATAGNIREVLRTLLSPNSLRLAAPWANPKLKRPFHWMASMLRGLEVPMFDAEGLTWDAHALGQPPYVFRSPDGYPDAQSAWAGLLQPRWGFASDLGAHAWTHLGIDANHLRTLLGSTPQTEWIEALNERLCGGSMPSQEAQTLQEYIDTQFSSASDQAVGEAFELVLASPSFQVF